MKWKGIRRDSLDVSTDASSGLLGINNRFAVQGELRLRRGAARTNIVKKDYPISQIAAFSRSQGQVSATLVDGDRWQGYPQPYALWGDNPDYSSLVQFPVPTFGYTFNSTQNDLDGANPFSLNDSVYSVWNSDPTAPYGWYHGSAATTTSSVAIASTGAGDCTFCAALYGDTALGNIGKYIQVYTLRFRAKLSLYQHIKLYDRADTEIYSENINYARYAWIAFVVHSGILSAYVDGALAYQGAEPIATDMANCIVTSSGADFGTSGICDIFGWNKALTMAEVNQVMSERVIRPWE